MVLQFRDVVNESEAGFRKWDLRDPQLIYGSVKRARQLMEGKVIIYKNWILLSETALLFESLEARWSEQISIGANKSLEITKNEWFVQNCINRDARYHGWNPFGIQPNEIRFRKAWIFWTGEQAKL